MHSCYYVLLDQVDTTPQRPKGKLCFYHIPFHFCRFFSPMKAVEAKTIQIAYRLKVIVFFVVCLLQTKNLLSLKLSTKVIGKLHQIFAPKIKNMYDE